MWQPHVPPPEEAEQAKREAERALADARNFDRRADETKARIERTARRNHIAESLEIVIRPEGAH